LAAVLGGCATVEPSYLLRLHPAPGAVQTLAIAAVIREQRDAESSPPLRLQVKFDAKVDHVEPVAGIRYDVDFVELSLLGDSKVITAQLVEQLAQHMGWADRVRGVGAVSDRGSLLALDVVISPALDDDEVTTALKRSAARVLASAVEALALCGIPFPDGAVQKGASWSGRGTLSARGQQALRELRYELIEADAQGARLRVHGELTGAQLVGRLDGELRWDFDKPLPVAGQLAYKLDVKAPDAPLALESDLTLGVP
jgi:hypothetical protein